MEHHVSSLHFFFRFFDLSFTTSHAFKSKSPSSRRTHYCASLLNTELRNIHSKYMTISLFKMKLRKKSISTGNIKDILMKKYSLDSQSIGFYSLDNLVTPSCDTSASLSSDYANKYVVISGKVDIEQESEYLKSQLNDSYHCLSVFTKLSSPLVNIIDVVSGGSYYLGSKLMFVLIPREVARKFPNPKGFHKALSVIESLKPKLYSNRGKRRKVLFENSKSNYVDLGVGVSRSRTGLYMKTVNGIPSNHVEVVEECFRFVNDIVARFLPFSLLEALSSALEDIHVDDFDNLKTSSEKLSENNVSLLEKSRSSVISCQSKFLPSASYGRNNLLPLHTDDDMFLSVVHVHSDKDVSNVGKEGKVTEYELKSDIVKYFTFDNYTSVAMRSGDILVFNPTIPHCISSCCDKYSDASTYCISHYFKTSIVGRNNNLITFSHDKCDKKEK